MANTRPPVKRYVLSSEIDRVKAEHPDFELQLPAVPAGDDAELEPALKSKIVKVPPAQRWSDDVNRFAQTNPIAAGKLLIGDENYAHMVRAGGSASILFAIIQEHAEADLGESSASSGS